LELSDDLIEPVAHGGVADLQQRGHFLEAAAGFDEVADEALILRRESGEHGERVNSLHLCATMVAGEPLDLESMLTTWAGDGKSLHLNKIER
jgi:hypothetical protein